MATKKRGLGRGLQQFVKDQEKLEETVAQEETLRHIPVEKIEPNPHQPRRQFLRAELEDLAESIRQVGILQPLVLVKKEGAEEAYLIVAGERRYRAAQLAEQETVPAVIRDLTDQEMATVALIENLQREDLNPIEEALAYRRIMDGYGLTQEELASTMGKSRSYIANTLRLLRLPEEIQGYLVEGKLTPSHGKLLLSLKDEREQLRKARQILRTGSTVRQVEVLFSTEDREDPYTRDAALRLENHLGTKVRFAGRGKSRRIEIAYSSDEELDRILESLLGEEAL